MPAVVTATVSVGPRDREAAGPKKSTEQSVFYRLGSVGTGLSNATGFQRRQLAAALLSQPTPPAINFCPMSTTETVTQLLLAWSDGDATALDRLLPYVETELRRLASYHMKRESVGHTLQTTALVNELYLKLVDQRHAKWQNRAHFFAVAAQLMRRILVDHARRQLRGKRGGGVSNLTLDEAVIISPEKSRDILSLNEALDRLTKLDPLKARIVELRHFGGLSVEETAAVLKISEVTVMRHWSLAKSWLRREVRG